MRVLRSGVVDDARRQTSGPRRPCRETRASVQRWEGRSVGGIEPRGRDRGRVRRRKRHNGHGDGDTHAHSTLSAESKVKVFYPFHPLHGATVQILRRPKRGDGAVSVIDRASKRLKIPVWMLSPEAGSIAISERTHLSKEALLSLASLLSLHAYENRGHGNLLTTALNECQGGHRGATGTSGPGDPGRKRNRARKCDSARRSGRSDGSHSGGGFSSERRQGR